VTGVQTCALPISGATVCEIEINSLESKEILIFSNISACGWSNSVVIN